MPPRLNKSKGSERHPKPGSEPRYFSAQVSKAQRFFLDLNPAPGPGLTVVSGGREHCRPDYEIRRSTFPFTTIEFVAGGAGQLWLADQEYMLLPGTIFVYGRNTPHCIRSDEKNPLVKYFAAFGGGDARSLMRECQLGLGKVLRVTHPQAIQQVFDDLIGHGWGDHSNRVRMCTVALQYLLMKIGDLALPYGDAAGRAFATYQQCRRHIEEHALKLRSMQEVADACHVNLSYLCRLFQRFGREQPNRYLRHLQLNHAAELLQLGRPIKEVAEELGFSDPFNFSRAFQRSFGLPPGRFQASSRTGGAEAVSNKLTE